MSDYLDKIKRDKEIPPIISELLANTRSDSDKQQDLMGKWLQKNPDVTPQNFQRFFEDFTDGVLYTYHKFGSLPNEIRVYEDGGVIGKPIFHPRKNTILVMRSAIEKACKCYNNPNYSGYEISDGLNTSKITASHMVFFWGMETSFKSRMQKPLDNSTAEEDKYFTETTDELFKLFLRNNANSFPGRG